MQEEVDMTELLEGKTAIIYGGGGGIGGGVARTFAREGAMVFLVGRTREKLDAVAKDIAAAGRSAEVAVLDALDEQAVDEHVRVVAAKTGSVDVSFNLNSASGEGAMPGMGSTGPADAATEAFMRYLAAEVGPQGVRVCGIWTAAVADTLSKEKLASVGGPNVPDPQVVEQMIAGM